MVHGIIDVCAHDLLLVFQPPTDNTIFFFLKQIILTITIWTCILQSILQLCTQLIKQHQ